MKFMIVNIYVNKLRALLPFIAPFLMACFMSFSALDMSSDIEIEKRVMLLSFLVLWLVLLTYCYRIVSQPKVIVSETEISIRSIFGKYEILKKDSCDIKLGQDYIDFRDDVTSKVLHLGNNAFDGKEWSRLISTLEVDNSSRVK